MLRTIVKRTFLTPFHSFRKGKEVSVSLFMQDWRPFSATPRSRSFPHTLYHGKQERSFPPRGPSSDIHFRAFPCTPPLWQMFWILKSLCLVPLTFSSSVNPSQVSAMASPILLPLLDDPTNYNNSTAYTLVTHIFTPRDYTRLSRIRSQTPSFRWLTDLQNQPTFVNVLLHVFWVHGTTLCPFSLKLSFCTYSYLYIFLISSQV